MKISSLRKPKVQKWIAGNTEPSLVKGRCRDYPAREYVERRIINNKNYVLNGNGTN